MSTLERAIAIAAEAHAGQTDKAGAPYILHPLRVMLQLQSNEDRIAGVLHDVIEDSAWKVDDLRLEGFPETVLEALDSVAKREGETYESFVERAGKNEIGRRVKLADLIDNSDLSRITAPSEKDHARIAKYRRAIKMLTECTQLQNSET
ncbi:MAG TPA: HD domain-containing protein [Candidatus Hydrogenedentes bacterium]|nr:HD domain-containing protein [Candidatus Hydrogenedentota bacterium]